MHDYDRRTAAEKDSERLAKLEDELLALQNRLQDMMSEVGLSPVNVKVLAKRGYTKSMWGDYAKARDLAMRAYNSVGTLWRAVSMGKSLAQLAEHDLEEAAKR